MHSTLRKIFFKKRTNYEFELFFRQTAQKKNNNNLLETMLNMVTEQKSLHKKVCF